jgi:hypothetical protein
MPLGLLLEYPARFFKRALALANTPLQLTNAPTIIY